MTTIYVTIIFDGFVKTPKLIICHLEGRRDLNKISA